MTKNKTKIELAYERIEKKLQEYKDNNSANLLLQSISLQITPGSIFVPELEAIFVSTVTEDKEIYEASGKGANTKYRLHARALDKLSQAANIKWISPDSGPVNMENKNTIAYRQVGGILKSTGELYPIAGYKDCDLDIELEIIKTQYQKKRESYNKQGAKWWAKDMSKEQQDEYINNSISRDHDAIKKYAPEKCETGARNRVIRSLLFIKSEYSIQELKKPFVVLRYKPFLDHDNPMIKEALLKNSLRAAGCIFGDEPIRQIPQPSQQALIAPIDAKSDPNIDTSEIENPENVDANGVVYYVETVKEKEEKKEPKLTNSEADFIASDYDTRIETIKALIAKKGYTGPADPDDPRWADHEADLIGFFRKLESMPIKKDDIPY